MVNNEILKNLFAAFPGGFINQELEFIAHKEANEYFRLVDCETELDVKCKVLEWLSRAAYKSQPFKERKNKAFHAFMLNGINKFLGAEFTPEDMEQIYTYLGNRVDHEKTVRFIESGYDMALLNCAAPVDLREGYSEAYLQTKEEFSHWPDWKKDVYNNTIATSAHAKKLELKEDSK